MSEQVSTFFWDEAPQHGLEMREGQQDNIVCDGQWNTLSLFIDTQNNKLTGLRLFCHQWRVNLHQCHRWIQRLFFENLIHVAFTLF